MAYSRAMAGKGETLADFFVEKTFDKWDAPPDERKVNLERYRVLKDAAGPLAFMEEVTGFLPRSYQLEVIRALCIHKRVTLRAPRGSGKSAVIANLVLWFAAVHEECKVPTTAGSKEQLEKFLWPEIHKWAKRADWNMLGKKPAMNTLDLKFFEAADPKEARADNEQPTSIAFGFKSDEPELMEGAHALNVFLVVDEAKKVPDSTFDAMDPTVSRPGPGLKWELVSSTPGNPTGRFHDLQMRKPGYEHWYVKHVTQEELIAEVRDPQQRADYIQEIAQKKKALGEDSALFRNYYLGEFADAGDECVCPFSWVQAAVKRWREWEKAGCPDEWPGLANGYKGVGVDIAGQGKDQTCIAYRRGRAIVRMEYFAKSEPMVLVNHLMHISRTWPSLRVEADALAAGPVSRIREILDTDLLTAQDQEQAGATISREYEGVYLQAIVSGSKRPEARDESGELGFFNRRSEMWWKFRERLDPESGENLMLPDDPLLINDLITPHWELRGSEILIEPKKEIRKRLRRSTDAADAVILAFSDDDGVVITERVTTDAAPQEGPRQSLWHEVKKWPVPFERRDPFAQARWI